MRRFDRLQRLRRSLTRRSRGTTVPRQPSGAEYPDPRLADERVAENVDALVDTVRDLLAAEEARDQSFNTRGVGLAGFVGIIVSLSTSLGRDALQIDAALGWRVSAVALFGLALAFLLSTVVIVVRGVLAPRETAHLSYDEVAQYPLPRNVYQAKVLTQGRTLRGLVEVLGIERGRGTAKARRLHQAYGSLIAALACIATLGLMLGLSDAEVIPHGSGQTNELRLCLRTESYGAAVSAAARELTLRASRPCLRRESADGPRR